MITLPDDHNWTTRRFSRSLMEAWPEDHAECIERPRELPSLDWSVIVPIGGAVMVLVIVAIKVGVL